MACPGLWNLYVIAVVSRRRRMARHNRQKGPGHTKGTGAMISFYTSHDGIVRQIESIQPGSWVDVTMPSAAERQWLAQDLGIAPEFVQAAFDDEETSHIDVDEDTGQVLVIVDCPFIENGDEGAGSNVTQYGTHPLSFVFAPEQDYFLTLSPRHNETVAAFATSRRGDISTSRRTRLLLQMLLRILQRYVSYLHAINRQIRESERNLRRSLRNEELIRMLGMEKSLVYFSTSLQGLAATVNRIGAGRMLTLYEDDRELLDDVMIKVRQAVEMCTIYTNILSGITDTFSNVISNNMNVTMRTLTIITLIMSIPTMAFGFWGMNVEGLPLIGHWTYPVIASVVMAAIAAVVLRRVRVLK